MKKCLLFPLIFQLYFIKEIGNLVPHWKELENLPKESAIAAYFTHRSCIFQAESLFLLFGSCTWHKHINTKIYFCQRKISFFKYFIRNMKTQQQSLSCVNNRLITDHWKPANYWPINQPNRLIGSFLILNAKITAQCINRLWQVNNNYNFITGNSN